jgi:hypothetical protein
VFHRNAERDRIFYTICMIRQFSFINETNKSSQVFLRSIISERRVASLYINSFTIEMEVLTDPFYHRIDIVNNSYYDHCYLKVRIFESNDTSCPYQYSDNYFCLKPVLENNTDWVYSEGESIFAGVCATLQAIAGVVLNVLVFAVFLGNAAFRKEYLTPFILSLATTDLLYSLFTLPIIAARNFGG